MIFLLLAIFSSACVSLLMRVSEKYIQSRFILLSMNYVMCLCLAGYYTGINQLIPQTNGIETTLFLGLINGILYLLGFVMFQQSIHKNGVVLSSIFMKLGVMVPTFLSIIIFHETPQILHIIGFIIAILAIVFIYFEKDTSTQFQMSLIILLIVNGSADAMSKIYNEVGNQLLSNHFLFYTFFVALMICSCIAIIKKQKVKKEEVVFGLLIGIPNYFSAKFLLSSLYSIPAIIVYPTYNIATIIVISIVGVLVFKEKISKQQFIGIFFILVSLALLNINL